MPQEKIKEIVDKYGTFNGMDCEYTLNDMLLALQEYGEWVRQQTLEEAIGVIESYWDEAPVNEVIKKLQALKDKNK